MKAGQARLSLVLLASFLAGAAAKTAGGFASTLRPSLALQLVLLLFVFSVSVEMGSRVDLVGAGKLLREAVRLSVSTVLGSAAGGVAAALLFGLGLRLSLAAALGMGWYSFDAPTMASYAGAPAGSLGFFSNFFRELLMLLLYPLAARVLGRGRSLVLGGATTMDTTLPVVRGAADPDTVTLAFAHGALVSVMVPVLVSLALA
ncbi:MAG: lysine exporter LysO family protein [Nitrososphaerota archaeon]|nr:lysine exporter LysO family protein [Nitrososphaerota archaeon]MDG6939808.1 lysine exporter LysO family protein [Nitrososphaerota archaeon]